MEESGFRTVKGYRQESGRELTETLEDYLEMLSRCCEAQGYTRLSVLSARLHVNPSSASRMMSKLGTLGFVRYERYGMISLTDKGRTAGQYLVWRHGVLERFFFLLSGVRDPGMRETELCEHNLSRDTVRSMDKIVRFFEEEPDIARRFSGFVPKTGDLSLEPADFSL